MPEETDNELPPLETDDEEDLAVGGAVDPADYVYTPDFSHMVVLRDGTDSRAWRVWDVVLEQFRAMGATRTSVKADAWRLQHGADFHRRRASNVGPGPRDVRPRVVWEHTALDLSPIARRRALSCCAHMLVAVLKGGLCPWC